MVRGLSAWLCRASTGWLPLSARSIDLQYHRRSAIIDKGEGGFTCPRLSKPRTPVEKGLSNHEEISHRSAA